MNDNKIILLLFALFTHFEKYHTYAPVSTKKVQNAIDTFLIAKINESKAKDTLDIALTNLLILSRIIAQTDNNIHNIIQEINIPTRNE